mmetsp:Transcript_32782/g.78919  ORF Transcript_32782/g.78919 Transcript_32782/m.78919 type:complete len:765 (+) Transcript_32782:83-2377(+)
MRTLAIATVAVVADRQAALANPIRRVVNMLQGLQTKVEAEAKEAEALFAKFQCYCASNDKKLSDSISSGDEAVTRLESSVKSTAAEKTQTKSDLASHKEDREAAKKAIAEATQMREKEHSDFTAESGDLKANIGALNQAIPAIEKGMAGSFLQTAAGSKLARIAEVSMQLTDGQKSDLQAFLQGTSQYAPASGQIVGILKTMKDEMEANLAEITKNENEAAQSHAGMVAAKNSEIAAATEAIEEKTGRAGDLAVKLVNEKNDLKETEETKAADESFLRSLRADCEKTAADQEAAKKARATELVAIADTIKMLNSDEAQELFKKTLPSPSLIQVHESESQLRRRALAMLRRMRPSVSGDLIMLALQGKKQGFEKVLQQIDNMVKSLAKEQEDDDQKKAYCESEIDKSEDEGKELNNAINTLETRIDSSKEEISNLESEIAALTASIKDLDKAVAEATEQRKSEHSAYTEEAANNNAALDLLGMAKNRLAKVYSPEQYEAAPARELTEEEKISEAYSFIQRDEPDAAPAVKGHSKQDAGGVVALMENLINDLKKEMQENDFTEKDAQEDYEKLMSDSKLKRAEDASARTEKQGALADTKAELLALESEKTDRTGELMSNKEYLSKLHADCDWNLQNYASRKSARAEEVESLKKAKDVLNGADFSLVQTNSKPALLSKSREQSCSASDMEHRRQIQAKFAMLQGFCEDMCKVVGKHPDCAVCDGFIPPDATPGVQTWDELYAQFDKLKLVGRDMIKEWTGDAGKFGR